MTSHRLTRNPVHLGVGGKAIVQELETGDVATVLHEGEYAINEPGVWHTANDTGPCTAVFITAGLGTEHRPR